MPETETTETTETPTTPPEATEPPKPVEVPDDHPLAKALKATRSELRDARSELSTVKADLGTASETIAKLTTEKDEATASIPTLEKERDEAKAIALRYTVAADKEVPLALADRLKGTTKEELEADAEALLQLAPGGFDGFDGGARSQRAPKTEDPEKAHGQFIAALLGGGSTED